MYVNVRRERRTCGVPVPSVFFNRNRNSFRIFYVKKGSETGIPVEFLSVARTPKGQVRPPES
jgi:hypothetical protein